MSNPLAYVPRCALLYLESLYEYYTRTHTKEAFEGAVSLSEVPTNKWMRDVVTGERVKRVNESYAYVPEVGLVAFGGNNPTIYVKEVQ